MRRSLLVLLGVLALLAGPASARTHAAGKPVAAKGRAPATPPPAPARAPRLVLHRVGAARSATAARGLIYRSLPLGVRNNCMCGAP